LDDSVAVGEEERGAVPVCAQKREERRVKEHRGFVRLRDVSLNAKK
jgi:hypothetical protein